MYQQLATIELKTGEKVEAGVVLGPDEEWRERIQELLMHKGDLWNWQNSEMITHELGIEARFHILHRDGVPFSHILTSELKGVGLLGHVWTNPEERGNGAASRLMKLVMDDFRARNGQALYLATGYDSPPFHIYRKLGFEGIEPESGIMTYFRESQEKFETEYFASGETVIEPLDWPHWPTSSPLFAGDWPETVRSAPYRFFGRKLTEGPLLHPIRSHHQDKAKPPTTLVLRKSENGAVVGLAAWQPDPLWPKTCLADVYCHHNFQDRAAELLQNLALPEGSRIIAYADSNDENKHRVLTSAGFQEVATLPAWLVADVAQTRMVDVTLFERS